MTAVYAKFVSLELEIRCSQEPARSESASQREKIFLHIFVISQ